MGQDSSPTVLLEPRRSRVFFLVPVLGRRKFCVPDGVLNIPMAQVGLQRTGVVFVTATEAIPSTRVFSGRTAKRKTRQTNYHCLRSPETVGRLPRRHSN